MKRYFYADPTGVYSSETNSYEKHPRNMRSNDGRHEMPFFNDYSTNLFSNSRIPEPGCSSANPVQQSDARPLRSLLQFPSRHPKPVSCDSNFISPLVLRSNDQRQSLPNLDKLEQKVAPILQPFPQSEFRMEHLEALFLRSEQLAELLDLGERAFCAMVINCFVRTKCEDILYSGDAFLDQIIDVVWYGTKASYIFLGRHTRVLLRLKHCGIIRLEMDEKDFKVTQDYFDEWMRGLERLRVTKDLPSVAFVKQKRKELTEALNQTNMSKEIVTAEIDTGSINPRISSAKELASLVLTADDLRPLARTMDRENFIDLVRGCLVYFPNSRRGRKPMPCDHFTIDSLTDFQEGRLIFKSGLKRLCSTMSKPKFAVDDRIFLLWKNDMLERNEPLPKVQDVKIKIENVRAALARLSDEEKFSMSALNSLILTPALLKALLLKSQKIFTKIAIGCFVHFGQDKNKPNFNGKFVDCIVGVSWNNEEYAFMERLCTVALELSITGTKTLNDIKWAQDDIKQGLFNVMMTQFKKDISIPAQTFIDEKKKELEFVIQE